MKKIPTPNPRIFFVVKANGQVVPFDREKIRTSLQRVGASKFLIDTILKTISQKLFNGITTKQLYRMVFSELRKEHKPVAGKYHLKRAIMELGPSGFPFEQFISKIFASEGYKASTNQIIQGRCVSHEVDVTAENDTELNMMECKYHSDLGHVCDVKISLYVSARYRDVESNLPKTSRNNKIFKGWLVTNTRLTTDAEKFGLCAGLGLMSWNFPKGKSLRERIDKSGLHPVTCLSTITQAERLLLLEHKIVLCKDLLDDPSILQKINLSPVRLKHILNEATMITSNIQTNL